jgi:hypothetical protein
VGRPPVTGSLISILVFSFYVLALSVSLLFFPSLTLPALGLPTTNEVWVRVAGLLLLGYWFYYVSVFRARIGSLLPYTVVVRSMVIVFFGWFVWKGWARPIFLVFGVIDLAGAVWTALALLAEGRYHPPGPTSRPLAARRAECEPGG